MIDTQVQRHVTLDPVNDRAAQMVADKINRDEAYAGSLRWTTGLPKIG